MGIRKAPRGTKVGLVGSAEIKDASIVAGDLATDSVEAGEIKAGAVGTDELGASAVTLDKMNSAAKTVAITYHINASDTAATDFEKPILTVPFAGTVTEVAFVGATQIGADTNYSTLALVNKGNDGQGNTEIAKKDFTAANQTTANGYGILTLHGTPANRVVAAHDVLTLKKTHTGNGQSLPVSFAVTVTIVKS